MTSLASVFVSQYLTCLTTSRSQTDKLAFDVGLQEHATGKSTFPDLLLSGVLGQGLLRSIMNMLFISDSKPTNQWGQEIDLINFWRMCDENTGTTNRSSGSKLKGGIFHLSEGNHFVTPAVTQQRNSWFGGVGCSQWLETFLSNLIRCQGHFIWNFCSAESLGYVPVRILS